MRLWYHEFRSWKVEIRKRFENVRLNKVTPPFLDFCRNFVQKQRPPLSYKIAIPVCKPVLKPDLAENVKFEWVTANFVVFQIYNFLFAINFIHDIT